MIKSFTVTALALLTLAVTVPAGPKHGGKGPHNPAQGPLLPPGLAEKLKLTEAQQAQLQEAETAFGQERDAWFQSKQEDLQALNEKMHAAREAADEDQMKAVRQQRMELMRPFAELRRKHLAEFRAGLTEEQQQILAEAASHGPRKGKFAGKKKPQKPAPEE